MQTETAARPARPVPHEHVRAPGRAPPVRARIAVDLQACSSCGAATTSPWFCFECLDRARPYREDDPYDEIGGEGAV